MREGFHSKEWAPPADPEGGGKARPIYYAWNDRLKIARLPLRYFANGKPITYRIHLTDSNSLPCRANPNPNPNPNLNPNPNPKLNPNPNPNPNLNPYPNPNRNQNPNLNPSPNPNPNPDPNLNPNPNPNPNFNPVYYAWNDRLKIFRLPLRYFANGELISESYKLKTPRLIVGGGLS